MQCSVAAQSVPSKLADDDSPLGALPAESAAVVGAEGGGDVRTI